MKRDEELGDSYTFLAIDRTSKLILTHQIGKRDSSNTRIFASKLREAIYGDCHITSDGFAPYTQAMPVTLWDKDITFAQLVKVFGSQTRKRRKSIFAGTDNQHHQETDLRRPDRFADLHVARRTFEFVGSHVDSPVHPLDQCVQQVGSSPRSGRGVVDCVLQFLPSVYDAENNASG